MNRSNLKLCSSQPHGMEPKGRGGFFRAPERPEYARDLTRPETWHGTCNTYSAVNGCETTDAIRKGGVCAERAKAVRT